MLVWRLCLDWRGCGGRWRVVGHGGGSWARQPTFGRGGIRTVRRLENVAGHGMMGHEWMDRWLDGRVDGMMDDGWNRLCEGALLVTFTNGCSKWVFAFCFCSPPCFFSVAPYPPILASPATTTTKQQAPSNGCLVIYPILYSPLGVCRRQIRDDSFFPFLSFSLGLEQNGGRYNQGSCLPGLGVL